MYLESTVHACVLIRQFNYIMIVVSDIMLDGQTRTMERLSILVSGRNRLISLGQ